MPWKDAWTPTPGKNLTFDSTVERIVPDPAKTPDLFVLSGVLLGPSPTPKVYRLYEHFDLSEYYEVAEDDIVWASGPGNERRLWIKYGAPIRYVDRRPGRAEASYLSGPIARELVRSLTAGQTFDWEAAGTEPTKCSSCNSR